MSHNPVKFPAFGRRIQITLGIDHVRQAIEPAIEFREMHASARDVEGERLLSSILRGKEGSNSCSGTKLEEVLAGSRGDHCQVAASSAEHCGIDNVRRRYKFLSINATPAIGDHKQAAGRIQSYGCDRAPVLQVHEA